MGKWHYLTKSDWNRIQNNVLKMLKQNRLKTNHKSDRGISRPVFLTQMELRLLYRLTNKERWHK
jgi:hypothetical protein